MLFIFGLAVLLFGVQTLADSNFLAAQFSSSMFPWPEQVKKPVGKAQTPEDEAKTILFSPMKLRDLELKNRIIVSPMCMYSSTDGFMTDFHLVHLGAYIACRLCVKG
jgi:hypothetical protein